MRSNEERRDEDLYLQRERDLGAGNEPWREGEHYVTGGEPEGVPVRCRM